MRVMSQMGTELLRQALPDVEIVPIPVDRDLEAGVEGEALLTLAWGSPNLKHVLERGVRWIHTIGTGVDRFPLELVGERVLTCSRGASAIPISEWVMAMLLAFEKRLPEAWITRLPERWNVPPETFGTLFGKTLGLVGLGGIGRAVAERALPFGMRIRALRRSGQPSPLPGVEVVPTMQELVREADHLVIAAPATAYTRHLVDAEVLAAAKLGMHLVNIARGDLVDQEALREALDSGRVGRASLDTVSPEPLPEGHWLFTHPHVRLSPHVSWSMPRALDLLLDTFTRNVRHWQAGEPLEGVVDVAAGY